MKVVVDLNGRALYFSRATIPFDRDGTRPPYFKHLGFYAYRKPALDRFVKLPESSLEKSERLEQLRFLENGISIFVGETPHDSVGVDTEEDLQRVIEILRQTLNLSRASRQARTWVQTCGSRFCFRPHSFAAARRLEMAGCEWKNHSTHFEGVRSARFCSASLFIEEMNGSTLGDGLERIPVRLPLVEAGIRVQRGHQHERQHHRNQRQQRQVGEVGQFLEHVLVHRIVQDPVRRPETQQA